MVAEYFPPFIDEDEYRQLEEMSGIKHEYFDGLMCARPAAAPRHCDLAAATAASLSNQLRGKSCVPRGSDQRLKTPSGLNTYPDIVVACEPLRYDGNGMTLLDATVLVEVISPSTAQFDRGAKFDHYAALPSLRHYVLIEQDEVRLEVRSRDETGNWRTEVFASRDDTATLSAIDCTLAVAELYERVRFDDAPE